MRHLADLLAINVPIFKALEKWEPMEVVAKELCVRRPDAPEWLLHLADAIRRSRSMQVGLRVLVLAGMRFPEEAIIVFTLAA